ncbi:unnamed protein product [Nezara viridula]|uniref:Neuropeptide n=1 Tax=Nezara viridula TaxID=85310 RepID=A0A9P0H9F0_NEZVI|nr:unnamed protein product [Nezara viridula]
MLLHYCVFIFILTKLGCFGAQWQILEDFKQNVRKYFRTGQDVNKVIDDFIAKKKYESLDFLYNIEHTPYLERSELRPFCTQVHLHLEGLLYSFKSDVVKLETPLLNIRVEIEDRLSDIIASTDVYQKLADNKHQQCRPGNYVCEEQIIHWLKEKVEKIQCRVVANCWQLERNHSIARRSVSDCEEFQCKNGECIPFDDVCNGEKNCTDGSDETPECSRYCFNGFHCRDLRCINKTQICDGTSDCGDGSDEESCKTAEVVYSADNCSLETGNFLCGNKRCVPLKEVCDKEDDCGDYSDESRLCEMKRRCAGGCTASGGVCLVGPKGPLCLSQCPEGTEDDFGTCRPGPQRSLDSLDGLFERVPYLFERYVGALALLKKQLISDLEKAFLSCQASLTEVRSFRDIRHPRYISQVSH